MGTKYVVNKERVKSVVDLYNAGLKMHEVAKKLGMSDLEAYAMTKHAFKYKLKVNKRVNRVSKVKVDNSDNDFNNIIKTALIKKLDEVITCPTTRALFDTLKYYL